MDLPGLNFMLGEDIDARERGTAVHLAVEIFETPENERPIDELITDSLKDSGAAPELIELEKPLWLRAGQAYLRWSAQRDHHRVDFATEETAGIIFQLVGSVSPRLKKLQEEGPSGRQKIMEWTRYAAVLLCVVQGLMWLKYITSLNMVYAEQAAKFRAIAKAINLEPQ